MDNENEINEVVTPLPLKVYKTDRQIQNISRNRGQEVQGPRKSLKS